jgi:CheY-like chemotaxis protein
VLQPKVVLLDASMPFASAADTTRQLLARPPQPDVCLLTLSEQAAGLFEAVAAGARGYLLKTSTVEEFVAGLRTPATGGGVMQSRLAAQILDAFSMTDEPTEPAQGHTAVVTDRERQLLRLIAEVTSTAGLVTTRAIDEPIIRSMLRRVLGELQRQGRSENDGPEALGSRVPRRPSPSGFDTSAAARPEAASEQPGSE